MILGSKEHKEYFCEELIKSYYENIWTDELKLTDLTDKEEIKEIKDRIKNLWPARIKMVQEYLKK